MLSLLRSAMEHHFAAPIWMTFKQRREPGGHLRKGDKGSPVVYANTIVRTEEGENGEDEDRAIPFLKAYTVFNIEQIEGLPAHYYAPAEHAKNPDERIAHAENFFAAIRAEIRHGGDSAFYSPALDYIQIPAFEAFRNAQSFYATLCHEATHWTKAKSRLDRDFGRKRLGGDGAGDQPPSSGPVGMLVH